MRYFVTVAGRTFDVDVSGEEVRLDGQLIAADLATLPGTSMRHLLIDGESHTIVAEPSDARGEWRLRVDGQALDVEVVDERTRAIRALTGAAAGTQGPKPVRAPMPGKVVRIQVAAGDEVRAGQGVAIVEAMKMENELKAETGGRVARVLVETGQTVEKGTLLVEFEAGE